MQKNPYTAFTLIELLVVISIITILALWISQISFTTMWDKQKLDTTVARIVSNIETVRWNALMWKWIWDQLTVPESYQIDFSTTWSGNIITYFLSWTLEPYNDIIPINFWTDFTELSQFKCLDLDDDPDDIISSTWTWTIIITWWVMSLTWSCNQTSSKRLELTVKRKQHTKTIEINTLNWLIKKD